MVSGVSCKVGNGFICLFGDVSQEIVSSMTIPSSDSTDCERLLDALDLVAYPLYSEDSSETKDLKSDLPSSCSIVGSTNEWSSDVNRTRFTPLP